MNILLVAQCNKNALEETRRILDQFAERKGERTWQTAITEEGLQTLRKLLRKSARRNTAVACHWIKGANQTELLWIVGNLRRFNQQGAVPTNTTERDILKSGSENQWHSAESVSLLAAIAGLFHDFGKANALFQQGLKSRQKSAQPYRHEWVSLRLFVAWVAKRSDQDWLTALSNITADDEPAMLANLLKDPCNPPENPFLHLPPLATTIAWLIVAHHRLPVYCIKNSEYAPDLSQIDGWLTQQFNADWNADNHRQEHWAEKQKRDTWQFPHGTPMRSEHWRAKAQKFAKRALQHHSLASFGKLDQQFTCHLTRLVLMLSDHCYSSLPATAGWQDANYMAYANTDIQTKQLKQKLDEHNIGVGQNALLLGRCLPHIRTTLPAITRHKSFTCRSKEDKFRWQDRAFDACCAIRERSQQQGFFGVNMASTGCGKTFANARIMYALSDEKQGCRFSVALGLRTLTLQTGDALREKLKLAEDDLVTLIGSAAVTQLHHLDDDPASGSASAEALFAEHQYVRYDGSLDDGRLSHWLKQSPKLHALLSAPVLITTIDHLIGATEGKRGGKQIAPMLRLLTSDLVLDEPDDFDLADLPALCRLVNWAGLLGARVLLSSATLPPALIEALFHAYFTGRKAYQQACGEPYRAMNICCAWFDEQKVKSEEIDNFKRFKDTHQEFVEQRVTHLQSAEAVRKGQLIPISAASSQKCDVYEAVAETVRNSMLQLHALHHQCHPSGKVVSIGVVRMANIEPLVAVARRLLQIPAPPDTRIHYCVYHSQHPLAMRSYLERRLDATLTRYQPDDLWQIAEIKAALSDDEQHHLFVVLATSVAEVGRDHDYDWAVAEPSSMRSLIQLAGRIQRHRQKPCQTPNLHILQKNINALRQCKIAYHRPGFESDTFRLFSHDLAEILPETQYRVINAVPRVQERLTKMKRKENFVELEHVSLRVRLFGIKNKADFYAAMWWNHSITWCAELQRRSPFRQSYPEELHYLWLEDEFSQPRFFLPDLAPGQWKESAGFRAVELKLAAGNSIWLEMDYQPVYQQLAEKLNMTLTEVSQKFGEISLKEGHPDLWHFHPLLGVFGAFE